MAGIKDVILNNREKKSEDKSQQMLISRHPFFEKLRPKRGYQFFSDYFMIDNAYATVVSYFHDVVADDGLPMFWMVNLIPRTIDQQVSVRLFNKFNRIPDSWVDANIEKAEGLLTVQQNEASENGSMRENRKLNKREQDLVEIAREIDSGSKYHRVSMRLLITAPTLELLDDAVVQIRNQYKNSFDTLTIDSYVGEQLKEFHDLYADVENQLGRNYMFTSEELGGAYHLLTHGIEDETGEYIGQMLGDLNNSAVIMDMDKYDTNVVIGGSNRGETLSGFETKKQKALAGDMFGVKIGMSALLNNHRVVHLVMNEAKVGQIGVDLSDITTEINMDKGDVNMFEMFGSIDDELSIFPAHLNKIVLMAQQAFESDAKTKSIIEGSLRELLTEYYVDAKMWQYDAVNNRDRIRIVGLPHNQYPRLQLFISYLDQKYKALVEARSKDPEVLHAISLLRTVFKDMLSSNGDLFNTITSDNIDHIVKGQRIIYNFADLRQRSVGVTMAQYVNALSFAVGNLKEGDVVILHGMDILTEDVKKFTREQFSLLHERGVRTVLIYRDIDLLMTDQPINRFDEADYLLLGGMSEKQVNRFKKVLEQDFTDNLSMLMVHKEPTRFFLRRGFDNVIFRNDMLLGVDFV